MKSVLSLFFMGILLGVVPLASFGENSVQRENIQSFFLRHRGNAIRSMTWQRQFQNQPVHWQGKVYKIEPHKNSHRVEILVKVLPQSMLYDTVVVLEGNTRLDPRIQEDSRIRFQGRIFDGVDVLGIREVHVLAPKPEAIQMDIPQVEGASSS